MNIANPEPGNLSLDYVINSLKEFSYSPIVDEKTSQHITKLLQAIAEHYPRDRAALLKGRNIAPVQMDREDAKEYEKIVKSVEFLKKQNELLATFVADFQEALIDDQNADVNAYLPADRTSETEAKMLLIAKALISKSLTVPYRGTDVDCFEPLLESKIE